MLSRFLDRRGRLDLDRLQEDAALRHLRRLVGSGYAATTILALAQPLIRRYGVEFRRQLQRYIRAARRDIEELVITTPARALKRLRDLVQREQQQVATRTEVMSAFPGLMTAAGVVGSVSSYVDRLHSNKRVLSQLLREAPDLFYVTNGQTILTSSAGEQNYGEAARGIDYLDAQVLITRQLTLLNSGVPPTFNENLYLTISDMWLQIQIINSSNQACLMEIYDIRPKLGLGATNTPIYPHVDLEAGLDALYGVADNSDDVVGITPYMSPLFVQNWSIYQTTRVYLDPGEIHTHRVHWSPNWTVPWQRFTSVSGGDTPNNVFERMTYCCMIRQHGQPMIGATSAGQSDFVTYAPSKLGVIWHKRIKWGWSTPIGTDVYITDNLNSTVGANEVVVPQTGVLTAYDEANP